MIGSEPKVDAMTPEEQWHMHRLVARCRKGLETVMDRGLRPYGISAVEMGILDALYAARGNGRSATPTELASRVVRRHNSVMGSLIAMERDGLVTLKKESAGRRTIEISLTPKGERTYEQALKAVKCASDVLEALTPKQRHQLTALLEKLDQAIVESLHGLH